jgi:hypothetical protein
VLQAKRKELEAVGKGRLVHSIIRIEEFNPRAQNEFECTLHVLTNAAMEGFCCKYVEHGASSGSEQTKKKQDDYPNEFAG